MRVPKQFNAPVLPKPEPGSSAWVALFLDRQRAAMQQLARSLSGPTLFDAGQSGTFKTVNPLTADLILLELSANTTLTLDTDAARGGAEALLELRQDAAGLRTVTWVNALTAPAVSTVALKRTLIGATFNGAGWVLRTLASNY